MSAPLWGLTCALSWGTADFTGRFTSERLGLRLAMAIMFTTGTLGLSTYLFLVKGSGLPEYTLSALIYAALAGITVLLATAFFYISMLWGPVSVAAPAVSIFPIFNIGIGIVEGRVPTLSQGVAMVVVMAGVYVVSRYGPPTPEEEARDRRRGGHTKTVLMAFLAAFVFSLTIWTGQQAAAEVGDVEAAWAGRMVTVVIAWAICLYPKPHNVTVSGRKLKLWLGIACVHGFVDTLGFYAVIAAHGPGAEIAVVISSGFAAVTVLLARIILREEMTLPQWGGVGMVLAGGGALSIL